MFKYPTARNLQLNIINVSRQPAYAEAPAGKSAFRIAR